MKIPKLKFKVGDRVYYKNKGRARKTTIAKIEIKTIITKKGTEEVIEYIAQAYSNSWYGNYKRNRKFKESTLFTTEEALKKGYIPTEKKKIEAEIKKVKNAMTKSRKSIKTAQAKLDEIRKEELVEKLSGI